MRAHLRSRRICIDQEDVNFFFASERERQIDGAEGFAFSRLRGGHKDQIALAAAFANGPSIAAGIAESRYAAKGYA